MSDMPAPRIWLERTGTRTLTAFNDRGVAIPVGHGEGRISPGELFQIALAGCQAMSADRRYAEVLGTEDFELTVVPEGEYDPETDRYTDIIVRFLADTADLSELEKAGLEEAAQCAIDGSCTVGHSIARPVSFQARHESARPVPSYSTDTAG